MAGVREPLHAGQEHGPVKAGTGVQEDDRIAAPELAMEQRHRPTLRGTMKTDIHPEYTEATVRCTCGNEFVTRSTKGDMHVEICSNCHPFYTGKQKLVDTGGRVERFQRKLARSRGGK